MKYNRGLATVAMALLAVPATTTAQQKPDPRTITVSATGEVRAAPDVAHISAGVTTEASVATDALAANNQAMTKVIAAIKAAGVQPADIQTSAIDVSPRYGAHHDGQAPKLTGYMVSNQVRFSLRNLAKLGEALDKVVAAGANQLHGITFEVSNPDALLDKARQEAMATAFRRAELYAGAARATLGNVLSIDEAGRSGPQPYPRARAAMASVPIETGSQGLSVTLTVTFEIK